MSEGIASASSLPAADLKRVRRLACLNLSRMRDLMEERRIPSEFDRAEYFIEWVARFLPFALDREFQDELQRTISALRRRDDFQTHGWMRTLAINAAMFLLTEEGDYLEESLGNLSHHNSGLRRHAASVVALVADRIRLGDDVFDLAARENIERHHDLSELATLLAVTNGTGEQKRQIMCRWCEAEGQGANSPIAKLTAGQAIPNPFFSKLTAVTRDALIQFAAVPSAGPEPPGGWGSTKEQFSEPMLANALGIVSAGSLRSGPAEHPLMVPTVHILDLPSDHKS